ncbi:MAG: hypothetical protein KJN93_10045 [Alphaproteobacteria bacterium]|nr:hypothetical protein [Alphaproteobacteria bacterium]NNF25554.1 hypothetical protein [Paracoccaceae bacterium]
MTASARFQIASLYFCYAVAGLFWGTLAAASPALQAQVGFSDGQWGLAMGVMALSAFPVMRIFGRRLHRIEDRAISLCLAVFCIGAVFFCFSQSVAALALALVLTGGASGALDIALNNRIARVEADTGARLFNRMHALFPAAMLSASAATGLLRGAGVPVWLLFAAIASAFVVAAMTEGRAGAHMRPQKTTEAGPHRAALTGLVALLALIAAAGAFQEGTAYSWAAIYTERVREAGPVWGGFAAAAFTLGLSAGRLVAHEVEMRISAIVTVRIAACITVPSFALAALGAPVPLLMFGFFLAGCGVGPIEPAVFRAVTRRAEGPARGPLLASVTAVAYLGYLLSPPALGYVAEYLGWSALWAAVAGLAALVVGLTLRIPPADR